MSEFDKWWEENYMNVSAGRTEAEDIYNLGVESQQAKIDILEVQLKGAEERAKLTLDHKNKMVDELQKKYDAMCNAFIVADDCRKEWHESYMGVRKERDELQARVDKALERMDVESSNSWGLWKEKADMYEQGASNAYEKSYWILKGNKDD